MYRKINRVGDRYGKLLVIEEDTKKGNRGQIKWICRCDCGNVTSILTDNLRTGITKSCGCLRNEALIDEVGNKYGGLKVISRVKNDKKNDRQARWLCLCVCGKEKIVNGKDSRSETFTSCGYCNWIIQPIKGKGNSFHPLFNTWYGILARCYNRDNPSFRYYGQLGIKVYILWYDSKNFYTWVEANLGSRPEGCSLDRINVYGNYEPGNLKWSNSQEQVNNRRLVLLSEEEYNLVMQKRNDALADEHEKPCAVA